MPSYDLDAILNTYDSGDVSGACKALILADNSVRGTTAAESILRSASAKRKQLYKDREHDQEATEDETALFEQAMEHMQAYDAMTLQAIKLFSDLGCNVLPHIPESEDKEEGTYERAQEIITNLFWMIRHGINPSRVLRGMIRDLRLSFDAATGTPPSLDSYDISAEDVIDSMNDSTRQRFRESVAKTYEASDLFRDLSKLII